jgi:hypothetical protein
MSSTIMDPWQLLQAVKNRTEYFQKKHAEKQTELFEYYNKQMTQPRWSWWHFKHVIPRDPTDNEVLRYARLYSWTDDFTINNAVLKTRMAENNTLRQLAEIAIRANQKVTISHEHSFIQKYLDPK